MISLGREAIREHCVSQGQKQFEEHSVQTGHHVMAPSLDLFLVHPHEERGLASEKIMTLGHPLDSSLGTHRTIKHL